MKELLKNIKKALVGEVVMSEELENGLNSNEQLYLSKNYPTDKGWVNSDTSTTQK